MGTTRGWSGPPPWWADAVAYREPDVRRRPASATRRRPTGPLAVGVAAVGLLLVAALVTAVVVAVGAPRTVTTPFLSYVPPRGWTAAPAEPGDSPALTGVVHGAGYTCGGEEFVRGFAAAALLPAGSVAPAELAERLARWFAATSYPAPAGTPPPTTLTATRPARVAGPGGPVDGTVTEATVRPPAGSGACPASGRLLVLAAPVSGGVAVLLAAADVDGGPAEPAVADPSTLDAVLASAQLRVA